jgi:hypothetical protein
MNELGNNPPAYSGDNNEKVDSLRFQMNLLFGCLLVASFTLTAYLGLQARRASLDLITLKGPAEESLRLVQQDDAGVEATFGKLTEFGRTHPDFQKVVLSNFHLSTNSAALKK